MDTVMQAARTVSGGRRHVTGLYHSFHREFSRQNVTL